MTTHDEADARFDAMLRDLGPEVPEPELDARTRVRLTSALRGGPVARRIVPSAWAAGLAVACVGLGAGLAWSRAELGEARAQTTEAMTLFALARASQRDVAPPEVMSGVSRGSLAVLMFDHKLCPIARACKPEFLRLEAEVARGSGRGARFALIDVTGPRRAEAEAQLRELGLGPALLAPLGAETGVVKVVDTARGVLLCSAPGVRGVRQASELLERAGG